MSWEIGTPNTATALAAMSPESVRVIWQKEVDMGEQSEDFFAQFEGASKDSPVMVINDTSVEKGLQFRITSRAGYYNRGKSGEGLFTTSADFAVDVINNNTLQADYLRNATSATQRTDEYMGMQGELVDGQAAELGKWMGREKSARAGMTFVLKGGAQNLLYSNGKTEDTLKTADGLTYDDILYMGQALKPMGGRPCEIGTINGNPVYKYCVIGTTPGLFSLKQDSDYKQVLRDAAPREKMDANPLFTGGYVDLDGHRITEYNPIDADGYSWVGSFFNPKAYLGEAITAGTAAFAIKGGGSTAAAALTNIDYFRFFPNYAFEFLPSDIYVPGTTEKYLLIVNPKGSVTVDNPQPGGVGMYAYTTGNIGYQITITKRLASVQNGPVALNQVGQVVWGAGVWATSNFPAGNSMVHPIGSTIIACNAYGTPIGDTVMVGAMALLRGYGRYRNSRTQWDVDGGFETRKYIKTVFGQALRKNVNGVYPGYVRIRHAISYPELGLPTIT
jgi:hypothetical protein